MKDVKHLLKMSIRVYRERGLRSLFFRVRSYLREFLSVFFKRGSVLYISGCPGGSRFYRCSNQSEELEFNGIKSAIVSQDCVGLPFILKRFKVFVFQRVIFNNDMKEIVEKIKAQNKPIIFETDDLVFDPQYISKMHYYTYMEDEEKGWYNNGIGREILEDEYVSNCVVSTDYLAKKIKNKYPQKKVFVSGNKLNAKQLKWANKAFVNKSQIKENDGKIRIGYFSGSRSHDNDFDTIANVLLNILKENPNVILMIVGHLKLNEKFDSVKSQIEHHSFVKMNKLPRLILRSDINIAPLEMDNPFCQAKSALKFFEAGILEVPTVATNTDSFASMISNGNDGFLASNNKEWHDSLKKLIDDEDLRKKIGKNAKKTSLAYCTNTKETSNYVEFLKTQIQKND